MSAEQKLGALRRRLRGLGSVAVAYSGGADSSFLLHVAREELGPEAVAFMATSPSFPAREREAAAALARSMGARLILVTTQELSEEGYASNPQDRCYHCKRHLLDRLLKAARDQGLRTLADGTNADDLEAHRHGLRAARELGVISPLAEAGLSKQEVRELSRSLGLPTADKPHSACLASRIPYGTRITAENLGQVERAEALLHELGLGQLRVRHHGESARIEVLPEDFGRVLSSRLRIVQGLRSLGFRHVCLDLQGFRSGSLEPGPPV